MSSNWLEAYLLDAVSRKLCTQIGCTTCGALEFRRGVIDALVRETGRSPLERIDREGAESIAKALAEVRQDAESPLSLKPAIQCLLFDLCSHGLLAEGEVDKLLRGSWAGKVLQGMREYEAVRSVARDAHLARQDPIAVQRRREEKARARQAKHEERLALKKERDRVWFARKGEVD